LGVGAGVVTAVPQAWLNKIFDKIFSTGHRSHEFCKQTCAAVLMQDAAAAYDTTHHCRTSPIVPAIVLGLMTISGSQH
jgi:hypothetical protein